MQISVCFHSRLSSPNFARRIFLLLLAVDFIAGFANETTYKGDVTYYYEWRGNYGSCALKQAKRDPFFVAAMSRFFMKLPFNITNPNNHPYCMEKHCIKVSGIRGSVVLKVSDTCYGCKPYDVDVADKVYPMLDDPKKGRIVMKWQWADCRKKPPGTREIFNDVNSLKSSELKNNE